MDQNNHSVLDETGAEVCDALSAFSGTFHELSAAFQQPSFTNREIVEVFGGDCKEPFE
jgi:hypothetical protein